MQLHVEEKSRSTNGVSRMKKQILEVHTEVDGSFVSRFFTMDDGSLIAHFVDYGDSEIVERWVEISDKMPNIIIPGAQ